MSKWLEHVRKYREQHKGKSYKECLKEAAATYQKVVKIKVKGGNWKEHVLKFRANHPELTLKECMQQASLTYKKPAVAAVAA